MAQNAENGEGTLAVTLSDSGRLIGQAGLQLYVLPWKPYATAEVELYYKLGRSFWGHGYAEEACRALGRFAFEKMNLLRLVTITHPDNLAPSACCNGSASRLRPAPNSGLRTSWQSC